MVEFKVWVHDIVQVLRIKLSDFSERDRHQLFVEPEGWDTCEIYVNGFSSSLPEDVQFKALRKVRGF